MSIPKIDTLPPYPFTGTEQEHPENIGRVRATMPESIGSTLSSDNEGVSAIVQTSDLRITPMGSGVALELAGHGADSTGIIHTNIAHKADDRIPVPRSIQDRVRVALDYARKNVAESFVENPDFCIAALVGSREAEEEAVRDIFLTLNESIGSPSAGITFEKLKESLIRKNGTESLAPEIIDKIISIEGGDSQCQNSISRLISTKARIIMIEELLKTHSLLGQKNDVTRLPIIIIDNRRDISESPEIVLGIPFDLIVKEIEEIDILGDANIIRTKRRDIEKRINDAAAEALRASQYENGENDSRVAKIQAAQQKLLHQVDRMLKDKERVADVDLALGGKREKPSEIDPGIGAAVEAERQKRFQKKIEIMKASLAERAFNSVASAAHVVALALGLTAAGAALYELGKNESDQPRPEAALDAGTAFVAPTHESAGIHLAKGIDKDHDIDPDLNTPGPMSSAVSKSAAVTHELPLADTYVVKPGDEVRKIVIAEIKEEGLKPTHEKVNTLTHIAMEVNGIPGDGSTLAIGTVLNLHNVHEVLDEMAGKPKAAEAINEGTASSVPVSPDYAWTAQGSSLSPMLEKDLGASTYGQYAGKLYTPYAPEEASASPKAEKAYSKIPTLEQPYHVFKKGEYPYKIIHNMLRASGFNWDSNRMNKFAEWYLRDNGITESEARKLAIGSEGYFGGIVRDIAVMTEYKTAGKKIPSVDQIRTIREERGE